MGDILRRLWTDPAYFRAAIVLFFGVVVPNLPLGEFGAIGYWIGRLAVPVALLVKAGEKNAPSS